MVLLPSFQRKKKSEWRKAAGEKRGGIGEGEGGGRRGDKGEEGRGVEIELGLREGKRGRKRKRGRGKKEGGVEIELSPGVTSLSLPSPPLLPPSSTLN